MVLKVTDALGATQNLSTTLDVSGNLVGATSMTDPTTGIKAAVIVVHTSDNQAPPASYGGQLSGNVGLLTNLAGNLDRQRSAPGTVGVEAVSSDGTKATYRYYSAGNTPAATPTDVFTVTGSNTKTVRIKKIMLSGLATTAGQFVWLIVRRSAADSGGTSTAPTGQKHDINDAAATAALALYTVNPSGLGTTVGTVRGGRLFHNLVTAQNGVLTFNFCDLQDKALILRTTSDMIAINGAGATLPTGATLDIEIEWEEDNS